MNEIMRQFENVAVANDENAVEHLNFDYDQNVARCAFADMLHDKDRNDKYYMGLKDAIHAVHSDGRPANVLDIGTGTGLLSMMAVMLGADTVTACEAFQPVADCAKEIMQLNSVADKIKLIPRNSVDIEIGSGPLDLPQRANILVTEIFDTELIGEGALSIFAHAHKKLLEENCIVVPRAATIFAQVVESPLALSWHKLRDVVDTDDGYVLMSMPPSVEKCAGSAAVHDVQLSEFPEHQFMTLVEPVAALRFDWSSAKGLAMTRSNMHVLRCVRTGVAHAVFVWWELEMDPSGQVRLSCAPKWAHTDRSAPWRDHWMQAIYYLPRQVPLHAGTEVALISSHDEYSLWFNLTTHLNLTDADYARPVCTCALHATLPRSRLGQLNDATRIKKHLAVLQHHVSSNSDVLVLSDASLLAIITAKLGAKHVYVLSQVSMLQHTFDNIAAFNGVEEKITFLKSTNDCPKQVDLIIADPYFTDALLPWDNLRLFDTLKLELGHLLQSPVHVLPEKFVLYAMALDFKHLQKIKQVVKNCAGFNVEPFRRLVESSSDRVDAEVEPQPLWEYPGVALSHPVAIQEFRLDTYNPNEYLEHVHPIEIAQDGILKGVVLWMDIHLDESPRRVISTGPKTPVQIGEQVHWDMYTRQGVYLLRRSLPAHTGDLLYVKMYYSQRKMKFAFQLEHLDI